MPNIRTIHRTVMFAILVTTLYIAGTGMLMQWNDIRSYFTHPPDTDPNMLSWREDYNGPPNYAVIGAQDYASAAFPSGSDFAGMLDRVDAAARTAAGDKPLNYVELRMVDGKPAGVVGSAKGELIHVDPVSGTLLSQGVPSRVRGPRDTRPFYDSRSKLKGMHTSFAWLGIKGQIAGSWIVFATAFGLLTMIVTGTIMYIRMWSARKKAGQGNLFWTGGSRWRSLHRSIAIVGAVYLTIMIVSGTWIKFEGFYFQNTVAHIKANGGKFTWLMGSDVSSPLKDAELPAMLSSTLQAQNAIASGDPIKVIRLRYYAGVPQGVVISGLGTATQQLVFSTTTGHTLTESEPEYPSSYLPIGWQGHQWAKEIHRGDWAAVPGKTVLGHFVALLGGLSLMYLCLSGIVMYVNLLIGKQRGAKLKKAALASKKQADLVSTTAS